MAPRTVRIFTCGIAAACVVALCSGCNPEYYRESADREVYALLEQKQADVLGAAGEFSLADYGGRPAVTNEVLRLTLRDALTLACRHSRSFQRERESLYLAALTLTGDRHAYEPRFSAALSASMRGDKETHDGEALVMPALNKAWMWGLQSAVRFSTTLLRSFKGDPNEAAFSALTATFAQPLLRGFGAKVAAERLTQSERNVVYAVRSFERARQTLAVTVTSQYLRALQGYDSVANVRNNMESTQVNYDRIEAQAQWGRVPLFQLDQAKTSVLAAQERVNQAETSLEDTLDNLKLTLGLPLAQRIELDGADLERLTAAGLDELDVSLAHATEVALECRLDLANVRDMVDDARRTVVIAEDQLRAQFDVSGSITVPSDRENNVPGKLLWERFTYAVGVDLDLPFDRTLERNTYRRALISLEREERTYQEEEDRVRQRVAAGFRRLESTIASLRNAEASRDVARQRVESTQELMAWGRLDARDLLESLDDLLK